jgi:cellobiose-specific phosphotransferase system component IIB
MPFSNNLKAINAIFAILIFILFSGCSKQDYRPGYAAGTKFPKINLKGFTLDKMQVHIGPRSVVAGEIFEEVAGNTASFEVPFAESQDVNRVVFYNADNTAPYAGSQIRFNTPAKDTTVKIFYDGKTFFQNPVFPVPTAGKMGIRLTFKSKASAYTGLVDLELHERYATTVKVVKINPTTGKKETVNVDTVLIKPQVSQTIKNIKRTEFNAYSEINAPVEAGFINYVFYVRMSNTGGNLPYPAGVTITPYDFIEFIPDYTALYQINDIRITNEKPNKINYIVSDRAPLFQ